jgi:crotonobetainyl-CoA:carnitine CoA-transferase CaiB-like acyl-CoA transferase
MILHAEHPEFDGLIVPGSPIKSAGDKDVPSTRSPGLGESTDEVLTEVLGYDSLRLSELRQRSII